MMWNFNKLKNPVLRFPDIKRGQITVSLVRKTAPIWGYARLLVVFYVSLIGGWVGPASARETAPAAPDYAASSAWAARPGMKSPVLDLPQGVASGPQSTDLFFIHPTTYLKPVIGNAAFDAGGMTGSQIDAAVLRFQASVFNACCRVYAPHYRQASLRAITGNDEDSHAADELAYADVKRAFEQFLRDTQGRPFVLAAHSQGSIHALRLLQDMIIGTELQRRMIVAYLPGVALPAEIERLGLPVCRDASATRCVVSWNSERRGHDDERRKELAQIWWQGRYAAIAGRPLVCVNPLNWEIDGTAAAQENLGGVYSDGREQPIPAPVPGVTDAQCHAGLLEVLPKLAERRHFSDVLTLGGVYHDFDYGLYYMNIRANVAQRIAAFAASSTSSTSQAAKP